MTGGGREEARAALEASGMTVLETTTCCARTSAEPSGWRASPTSGSRSSAAGAIAAATIFQATLARIDDGSPVVLLAHQPDIFPAVPPRVALHLSGHTHGGRCRLPVDQAAGGAISLLAAATPMAMVNPAARLIRSGGLGFWACRSGSGCRRNRAGRARRRTGFLLHPFATSFPWRRVRSRSKSRHVHLSRRQPGKLGRARRRRAR